MTICDESSARQFVQGFADEDALKRLDLLAQLLIEENSRQNLISKPSQDQMWQRHIADSVQLLKFVPRETCMAGEGVWLDLGTGAGFPGLVVAAIFPQMLVILVESRKRRVEWLNVAKQEMGLSKCEIDGRRLEVVEPFPARFISARAFAPLPKLLRLSAPFSTAETTFLLPKGRSAAQELQDLPRKCRKLFHVEQSLTDPEAGIIVSN
ncbi:MAG: 16S rRNA (guanine(527)-N(7))-methyltransferase RsmG [Erythrobacter sp.]